MTIYGHLNSVAHSYAFEHGIKFVELSLGDVYDYSSKGIEIKEIINMLQNDWNLNEINEYLGNSFAYDEENDVAYCEVYFLGKKGRIII